MEKEKLVINGGKPLTGEIEVSGMKNSAVAIIFGTILTEDKCVIENLPNISDVTHSLAILQSIGAKVKRINKTTYEIDTRKIKPGASPYDLVRKMRASYYILGAELGRFGKAHAAYPGGCDFGTRPIDQHIKGFEALGAKIDVESAYIDADATANGGLVGANIYMDCVTVGATINIMLAACKANGTTVIDNAAREPHVVDLANFLNASGANITGAGTDVIKIKGVQKLHGVNYAVIPDMIEAGTFMVAAAATGGDLLITNLIPKHVESISAKLIEMGVNVEEFDDSIRISRSGPLNKISVKTLPYPGFPTDMNPQMCVLMCLADGVSMLSEGVWDNRFRYVEELILMGADIKVDGKLAVIQGPTEFSAAPVKAVDLRAGAAMIIAGLVASGKTEIENIHHIQRGYEDIVGKLSGAGADIKLVTVIDNTDAMPIAN
ncbi:MAG: UDP-N-acetylglucosamine 1-carboxyvinyltransferase [Ruminococcaceae bacterium]|nr:UDP-N-acetylglucosamine 1-carboxyvinyltransferase [Oscillospiraceae bacterium]